MPVSVQYVDYDPTADESEIVYNVIHKKRGDEGWLKLGSYPTKEQAIRSRGRFSESRAHHVIKVMRQRPGVSYSKPYLPKREKKEKPKKETRLDQLRAELPPGWSVETWTPGDGATRYRFFENAPPDQTYFGPMNGAYTALGLGEAQAFARGLGSSR